REQHVVVAQKYDVPPRLGIADELDPLPDQGLARLVGGVRLTGDDDLYRSLGVSQQSQQALRIMEQQIRALVGRETEREADRQHVRIEHVTDRLELCRC